jgi:heme/copper-type cytochrome/quinol oxidase subunit 2
MRNPIIYDKLNIYIYIYVFVFIKIYFYLFYCIYFYNLIREHNEEEVLIQILYKINFDL